MLTIPKGIKFKRSKKAEAVFVARLRAWLESEERSKEIHASELLDPRMGYWARLIPKPLTDQEVMMFAIGKGYHERFLPGTGTDSGQKWSAEFGITYAPDEIRATIPRELKTTRSFYAPKVLKDISLYLEQLQIYQACENSLKGALDIVYLNLKNAKGRTEPAMRAIHVTYTPEQLQEVKDEIVATVAKINVAKIAKTPEILPLCRPFKCGTNCKWWTDCKPEGRFPEENYKKWPK